jgi:hypothetical protein
VALSGRVIGEHDRAGADLAVFAVSGLNFGVADEAKDIAGDWWIVEVGRSLD